MKNKVFNKAIAIVLVTLLCMVAAFTGSVTAVSANYTVTGAAYEPGTNASYVTATVKFTSSSAFVAGMFTVDADSALKLVDASTAEYAGQQSNGTVPVVHYNVENDKVLFTAFTETKDFNPLTSLSVVLKFAVKSGSLADFEAGTVWAVSIKSVDVTDKDEATYTVNGAAGSVHIHNYGTPTGSGAVKEAECSICHAKKQIINESAITATNKLSSDVKTNVTFTDEGDVVLNALLLKSDVTALNVSPTNIYFYYTYYVDGGTETAVATGYQGTGDLASYYVFPCVGDSGIGRVSMGVTGKFVITDGAGTTISENEWQCSILKWVNAVINGSYSAAQKNYAKALYNYAKETSKLLGNGAESAYTADYYTGVSGFSLAGVAKATADIEGEDDNWNISGVSVTTGFKPKMNIRFDAGTLSNYENGYATVKIYDGEDLVYSKKIAFANLESGNIYSLYDVPAKYLANDVVIGVEDSAGNASAKTVVYGYSRYTKARVDKEKEDGNLFKYMMDYAVALNAAY